MRHRKHTFKIGRTGAHRTALLANQVCSLIFSKEIETTLVKAKETRRLAEKMVTLAKKGTLHARRLAISKLRNEDAVKVLFNELASKYMERKGGYTKIIQLEQRIGDAATMCILQWTGEAGKAEKKAAADNKDMEKSEEKKA